MPFAWGVHVWIEVDGAPLPEYQTRVEQQRTTCFIPSQEGKNFCVRFRNIQPPVAALRGNIFLDGIPCGAGVLLATDTHATMISGQTRLEGLESPFQFARLQTTDDEAEACQDETRLRELGTVRVQIEWVNVIRQEAWHPPSTSGPTNQPIHERSKKASAHCASLGDVQISRPKSWYMTVRLPYVEPVEFVFQYAPLDWLRAQDIVSNPSASTSTIKRRQSAEIDTKSEDAVSELLDEEEAAAYRRLQAKITDRKHANKRCKTIKREPGVASGTNLSNPPEVIDLTGED